MPEILPDHVPSPRTLLAWDGTAYRPITIDAAGHLQIDVLTSVLPVGAATEARLVVTNILLTQIASLRDALQSVATNRLIVRGEDQLFSYDEPLHVRVDAIISGAGGFIGTPAVGAGVVWVVTAITARDQTTAPTAIILHHDRGGVGIDFAAETRAFGIGEYSSWSGHQYLEVNDTIRAYFIGGLAGDDCDLRVTGYVMTKE